MKFSLKIPESFCNYEPTFSGYCLVFASVFDFGKSITRDRDFYYFFYYYYQNHFKVYFIFTVYYQKVVNFTIIFTISNTPTG